MLFDFEYSPKSKKVIISEIDDNGKIRYNYYNWRNPQKYVICEPDDKDRHPKYHTWDDKPVKLVNTNYPNRFAMYEFIDRLPIEEKQRLYEYKEPDIYFIDIETEIIDSGFVQPKDANSMIQTIAIVKTGIVYVLGLKDLSNDEIKKIKYQIDDHFEGYNLDVKFTYKSFREYQNAEYEMLNFFFTKLVPKMTVMTGWNFLDYDWQFLVNRARILGIKPEISSYTNKLENIFGTTYEVPAHRMVIDYMNLYKKWDTSIKIKESDKLEWVGGKILEMDHAAKVSYNGSLQDLYIKDFSKYVFYNAVDTVLVQLIHEKRKYINIAYSISNLAHIRLCDFSYKNLNTTLVQTEGFLRERFREKWNIVFCKDEVPDNIESIPGGWVKPPNKGINEWLGIFDFASLYPSVIMQFNIAPESFKGFVMKDNPEYASYNGRVLKIEPDDIVCNNKAVFRREKAETIKFLEELYKERKKYKNMMLQEYKQIDIISHEIEELEQELLNL